LLQLVADRAALAIENSRHLQRAQFDQARWQATVDGMVDLVFVADAEGRAIYMNEASSRILGIPLSEDLPLGEYSAQYHLYRLDGSLFEPEELPLQRAALRNEEVREVEVVNGPPGGDQRILVWNAAPLRDETDRVIGSVAVGRDVTAQRQAEKERQELLRRLVTAQEEERRRISRELHDQIGQHLTALLLGLRALRDTVPEETASRELVRQLEGIAGDLGREAHRLALELRPTALDDLGLEATLQNYAEEWAERTGVAVDCQIAGPGPDRLPSAVETAVYRIVQEALTNVARHAGARQVSLIIKRRDGQVVTIVEDDGCGFDVDKVLRSPGVSSRLGLLGIRERVASLGGWLQLESTPGEGTTLYASIPLSLDQEAPHGGSEQDTSLPGR
jgi:PAS domain S-box-containing protein